MNIRKHLSRERTRGVVLPIVVISMATLLSMGALALDVSMLFLAKTRIQNGMDAASLSGARTLKVLTGNWQQARTDALATYSNFYSAQINFAAPDGATPPTPIVEFSDTLIGSYSQTGSLTSRYIRVRLENSPVRTFLAKVIPGVGDRFEVGGSAVAGPQAGLVIPPDSEVCDLLPFVVGIDPLADRDCSDGVCFGYTAGQLVDLRPTDGTTATSGAGNYNLLRLGGNGANVVRNNLASGQACEILSGSVDTEPGVEAGPVAQGINTRFNQYSGGGVNATDHPPDVVIAEGITYAQYLNRVGMSQFDVQPPTGVPRRRVVSVVLADFTNQSGGVNTVFVEGLACFFLRNKAVQGGPDKKVIAEFITDCDPEGLVPSEDPGDSGFFEIILYKDPDGTVS